MVKVKLTQRGIKLKRLKKDEKVVDADFEDVTDKKDSDDNKEKSA